jgi:hypothetical protein
MRNKNGRNINENAGKDLRPERWCRASGTHSNGKGHGILKMRSQVHLTKELKSTQNCATAR